MNRLADAVVWLLVVPADKAVGAYRWLSDLVDRFDTALASALGPKEDD